MTVVLRTQYLVILTLVGFGPTCFGQSTPTTNAKEAVATVAGQAIYEADLQARLAGRMRELRNQEYQIKTQVLEALINQKLTEIEAAKKGIAADELVRQEVDSKIADPTDGEVEAYYLGQKDRLKRSFEVVKAQLRQNLKQVRIQEARQAFFKALRAKADVTILLRPPRTEVAYDPARVRGNPQAPITIVEFSDFQCPFCQRADGTVKELLSKYKGRVKLAYRDFPLSQIHSRAQEAAEASRCAAEQGKFWEYHDLLFSQFGKLDRPTLVEHARSLKLDAKSFEDCLSSGKHSSEVERDQQEGTEAGVNGTPAFFINGVFLSGAQPAAAFEKIIDEELAALDGNHPAQ
jgi:protein-disulfide isomerase